MKEIRLRHCNGVDLNRTFSAKIVGGGRGYDDALALETYSNDCCHTLRTITGFIVVALRKEKEMITDNHKYVRAVYKAMKRLYGTEKVQDECLRLFKIVFPRLHEARTTEEYGFNDTDLKRMERLFSSWNPEEGSRLDILLGNILTKAGQEMSCEEFIAFCEDITPVVMRIRKLTPRECGRLMGVSEKDLDTMLNCGISRSSLYKLFGNSIVCDVLFHIFRKMFIDTEPDMVKGEATQLSLF